MGLRLIVVVEVGNIRWKKFYATMNRSFGIVCRLVPTLCKCLAPASGNGDRTKY